MFLNVAAVHMMITGQAFLPPSWGHAKWMFLDSLVYVAYAYTYYTGVRKVPAGKELTRINTSSISREIIDVIVM